MQQKEHGHLAFGRAEHNVTKHPTFPRTKGRGRKCSKPVIYFFFLKYLKDFKC